MADDLQPIVADSKPIYLSKTFWVNIILAVVVPLIPKEFAPFLQSPEVLSGLFVVINILLRLISKDKVTLV